MASKEAAPDKERPGSHALDALETSGDVPELLEKPERPVAPDDVSGAVDVESGRLEPAQPQPQHDQNIVTWDGQDDPENPQNWPYSKKWGATVVVSSFTFISPVSSTMAAPALAVIAKELNITSTAEQQLILSVFVLAYAVGPLILAPLSEIYGRVIVLQLANVVFLIFNLACGLAQTKVQLIIFRFFSGLGGSAPLAVGSGVLSDCWKTEERGKSISIYSLGPILGPAIGPIAGGFITENTSWRWSFYAVSIADAVIQLSGLFFLHETYTPILLKRKANRLMKETGNMDLRTEFDNPDKTMWKSLLFNLGRPFQLLGTQFIVQVLALYMALVYGIMYLMLSTFPILWGGLYGESIGIGGLNYISLCCGFFIGTQISAPFTDKIYKMLKSRNNGVGLPEHRIPLMIPAACLVPIGLFWYGWSADAHLHWIMPNIGAAIFCAGMIIIFQCVQTYIVDCYTRYAASAIGAATVLRSLAGCFFPLFAPEMYAALHFGWGNSLLAFIAIGIGFPAPFILWKYGPKLRKMSSYATGE